MPDGVRRSLDRLAQWIQTEFRLIMGEVRAVAREVRGLVAQVKELFASLDARMTRLEQRVATASRVDPPRDAPPTERACRHRLRRRPGGPGSCRGRRPDH